jgi:hypothetical protein
MSLDIKIREQNKKQTFDGFCFYCQKVIVCVPFVGVFHLLRSHQLDEESILRAYSGSNQFVVDCLHGAFHFGSQIIYITYMFEPIKNELSIRNLPQKGIGPHIVLADV